MKKFTGSNFSRGYYLAQQFKRPCPPHFDYAGTQAYKLYRTCSPVCYHGRRSNFNSQPAQSVCIDQTVDARQLSCIKNKERLRTEVLRTTEICASWQNQGSFLTLTLGDFLSVFLLTRTGLSYFTRETFGGIILPILTRVLVLNIYNERLVVLLL